MASGEACENDFERVRGRVTALIDVVGQHGSLERLVEAESPAKSLLEDEVIAAAVTTHLAEPTSGHGNDPLCQWLYNTFQVADQDLQAVVLRFVPLLCGQYLSRITGRTNNSLAGFEAVLLALYNSEVKARNGRSLSVNIPDLAQPSLYHTPRTISKIPIEARFGQLAAPLEPQDAVKATKRACVVGVALELFCRRIAMMPHRAKIEACLCGLRWASVTPDDDHTIDDGSQNAENVVNGTSYSFNPSPSPSPLPEVEIVGPGELFHGRKQQSPGTSPRGSALIKNVSSAFSEIDGQTQPPFPLPKLNCTSDFVDSLPQLNHGIRVLLPWELIQPLIKILGHCLFAPMSSQEVKDAASVAIWALHRRACYDLVPEAILATRSLMRLDVASRASIDNGSGSTNLTGSSKVYKPRIPLL